MTGTFGLRLPWRRRRSRLALLEAQVAENGTTIAELRAGRAEDKTALEQLRLCVYAATAHAASAVNGASAAVTPPRTIYTPLTLAADGWTAAARDGVHIDPDAAAEAVQRLEALRHDPAHHPN